MVPKIIAALKAFITGPFALSLGMALLIMIGIAIGALVAAKMDEAAIQKQQAAKAAAEEAAKPPPPPQRVVQADEGPNPFEPLYVSLGEEILSPLPGKSRVLLIELELMTMRGKLSEDLLKEKRIPLRAQALSILSELTVAEAQAEDAQQKIAEKIMSEINKTLKNNLNVAPVQQVLIKRYYVQ
jgi:flagellar basal body-associated protein FliL